VQAIRAQTTPLSARNVDQAALCGTTDLPATTCGTPHPHGHNQARISGPLPTADHCRDPVHTGAETGDYIAAQQARAVRARWPAAVRANGRQAHRGRRGGGERAAELRSAHHWPPEERALRVGRATEPASPAPEAAARESPPRALAGCTPRRAYLMRLGDQI